MSPRFSAAILLFVVLTRIPLLLPGYGADPDAWRTAYVASELWTNGTYEVSRFPGYPLHEILMAPLVGIGGALLSNSITLLAMCLLLLVWTNVAGRYARHSTHVVIAMAFAPLLWNASAATMDYTWSLLLVVCSILAGLHQRWILAGLCVGVAAGFRPMNLLVMVPLVTFICYHPRPAQHLMAFIASSVVFACAALSPLLFTYGIRGWVEKSFAETITLSYSLTERFLYFGYRSIYAIGPLAAISILWILFIRRRVVADLFRQHSPIFPAGVAGVASYLILFFLFPLEREYLLPALPFLLLVIDAIATRKMMTVFVIALVSFAFINVDVIRHDGARGTPGLDIREGITVEDIEKRRQIFHVRNELFNVSVPQGSVIMTGGDAVIWFENPDMNIDTTQFWQSFNAPVARSIHHSDRRFIGGLTRAELDHVRAAGYSVSCYSRARTYLESALGYRMDEVGVATIGQPEQ